MNEPITMYTTTTCGHCVRLGRQLDEAKIAFRTIDVDEQEHYGDRIMEATGGLRIVPTLQVGARLLVNPTLPEVRAALEA